ncbi:MAG: type I glutamate--ammonia ligase [bacterium]|nr:type I glutamate--ammonia ligase [bacterium]
MPDFVPSDDAKKSPAALLKWASDNNVQELDVRFVDVRGIVQHFSMPISMVDEGSFEDGFGFDGSSVKGFQAINESDLILMADLSTACIDPFFAAKTLTVICDVYDPIERTPYPNDPRGVAKRALDFLQSTGLADTVYFGPEAEFFLFSNVRYTNAPNISYYEVDSHEGFWNTGSADPSLSYLNRVKEGYFPLPPLDKIQDVRAEMVATMMACGIPVEVHHHEVGGAAQAEIDMRFDTMLTMADKLTWYKYIVKNVATRHGLIATFMPKPLFGDNGSGMHCHQSLWKGGQPLFFDENGYAGLSEMALYYIGGILKHAPAILAFAAPTTNSYRRLVPGYEAPVNLVYSKRNRSAAVRIPMYSKSPKAKRIEFRAPDPAANPYLAFSAMLLAGLDGILNKIHPGEGTDVDLYEAGIQTPTVPGSLGAALQALADDHEFLLAGGVFSKDYIEGYIDLKQVGEADVVSMRPHPYEFQLYFDC